MGIDSHCLPLAVPRPQENVDRISAVLKSLAMPWPWLYPLILTPHKLLQFDTLATRMKRIGLQEKLPAAFNKGDNYPRFVWTNRSLQVLQIPESEEVRHFSPILEVDDLPCGDSQRRADRGLN